MSLSELGKVAYANSEAVGKYVVVKITTITNVSTYQLPCPDGSYITCWVITTTTNIDCYFRGFSNFNRGSYNVTTTTCQFCS